MSNMAGTNQLAIPENKKLFAEWNERDRESARVRVFLLEAVE